MSKNKGYKKIGTKNGKNIYEAIIEVGFDINGKRKRKRKRHTGNNQSAEIWYAELVKEYYHKAKKINVNDTTFEEYSILFILSHKVTEYVHSFASYDRIKTACRLVKHKKACPVRKCLGN